MLITLEVQTHARTEMLDLTAQVQHAVQQSGVIAGICYVFVPHTTAGVTINEHADPAVQRDILTEINQVIPFADAYTHGEGNSAAHIKASLFGAALFVIIDHGELVLGTWQGLYFCEFDGPRRRKLLVKIMAE